MVAGRWQFLSISKPTISLKKKQNPENKREPQSIEQCLAANWPFFSWIFCFKSNDLGEFPARLCVLFSLFLNFHQSFLRSTGNSAFGSRDYRQQANRAGGGGGYMQGNPGYGQGYGQGYGAGNYGGGAPYSGGGNYGGYGGYGGYAPRGNPGNMGGRSNDWWNWQASISVSRFIFNILLFNLTWVNVFSYTFESW